jgi:hypothetical protein
MKCTGDVYLSLHIPAALFPEHIRYDSVRSIIAKIGRHSLQTGVSVVLLKVGGTQFELV